MFDYYARVSGQIFNFDKSSLFFSPNTKQQVASDIKSIFNLKEVSMHEKYLGLPSMVGRNKKCYFNEVKLKVMNKIKGWHSSLFSIRAKEVLIKAVAQAIPTYAMSVFKVPLGLCDDLQKLLTRFWWGAKDSEKKIHWIGWKKLAQPKKGGGMGFREFDCFNQALLAKQEWRILQKPNSLMARVLKARYFRAEEFFKAKLGSNPSFVWRSVLWGRDVLQKGLRWMIGNGDKVSIYNINWLPRPQTFKPFSPHILPIDTKVKFFIKEDNSWDVGRIRQFFFGE